MGHCSPVGLPADTQAAHEKVHIISAAQGDVVQVDDGGLPGVLCQALGPYTEAIDICFEPFFVKEIVCVIE
jgi:hypothetical protein